MSFLTTLRDAVAPAYVDGCTLPEPREWSNAVHPSIIEAGTLERQRAELMIVTAERVPVYQMRCPSCGDFWHESVVKPRVIACPGCALPLRIPGA